MDATTSAILNLLDTLPQGRSSILSDLAPQISDKVFFSPEAVAKRYDVSLSCVKTWRAKGLLIPSMKIPGGTARYTLADLAAFEKRAGKETNE